MILPCTCCVEYHLYTVFNLGERDQLTKEGGDTAAAATIFYEIGGKVLSVGVNVGWNKPQCAGNKRELVRALDNPLTLLTKDSYSVAITGNHCLNKELPSTCRLITSLHCQCRQVCRSIVGMSSHTSCNV